jgi:hypothetical protein
MIERRPIATSKSFKKICHVTKVISPIPSVNPEVTRTRVVSLIYRESVDQESVGKQAAFRQHSRFFAIVRVGHIDSCETPRRRLTAGRRVIRVLR